MRVNIGTIYMTKSMHIYIKVFLIFGETELQSLINMLYILGIRTRIIDWTIVLKIQMLILYMKISF